MTGIEHRARPTWKLYAGATLAATAIAAAALLCAGLAGARGAPSGVVPLGWPSRADGPALFLHRGSYHGKPRATLFTAIPATLPVAGGTVRVEALVEGATLCRFSSTETLKSLPALKRCAAGAASITVHIPRNGSPSKRTYRFALSLSGPRGKGSAPSVSVRQSGGKASQTPGSSLTTPTGTSQTTPATPPAISTEPASAVVLAGNSASFSAAASGSPTPTVQWLRSSDAGASWSPIAGATATTYSFTTTAGDSGEDYEAVFTNSAGTATTAAATLTVDEIPAVTTQPNSDTVDAGNSASFTAAASGSPTPTVQWLRSTDGGTSWSPISGATATTYVFSATAADSASQYEAVFTSSAGSATTSPATLTVDTTPAITIQPLTSETVDAGDDATFTATATGNPAPTVQWELSNDGGASWSPISGATATTYAFTTTAGDSANQYEATFTNSAGSATTNAATLTVNTTPAITTQPLTSETVVAPNTASFIAAASGNPTPTVQWQVSTNGGTSWNPINGATSPTYTFTTSPDQTGDEYEAVFTNSAGAATTNAATLTVNTVPVITTEPVSASVVAGNDATFTATATGNPTPTLQWELSTDGGATWNPIGGATATTYSFSTTTADSGDEYEAVFTNSAAVTSSDAATLTVTPTSVAPAVSGDPTNETVLAGATASFTAAASGSPTPTVQWDVSTDGGVSWAPISGATAPTYAFTTTAGDSASQYEAVFTNSAGSATTNAATLTVNTTPAITTQPLTSETVVAPNTASFTAAASGNPTPTVQWEVSSDGGVSWTPISGATSATYTFTTSADQTGDEYEAVFTNSAGSATTNTATLTVATIPGITTQPTSDTVVAGNTASFTAAASGNPTPTVQWQVSSNGGTSWTAISGATAMTYSFTASPSESGDEYEAVFTNSAGAATTNAATLTVNTIPTVTTQPTSDTVDAGNSASFTAAASGSPTPTVQWDVSTDGGVSWAPISGATSPTYTFTTSADQTGDQYEAVFTNSAGAATTNAATLTVATIPGITTQPTSDTVVAGNTASFTAAASGNPTPTVQWQVSSNGGTSWTAISGATAMTYSFTASPSESGDEYEAVFTNSAGSATTNAATLTVNTIPTVTTQPTSDTVDAGNSASFTAAASGSPTPTVQWDVSTDGGVSWAPISGATSPTYTFTTSADQTGDQYEAIFTNSAGAATTNAATLTVNTIPAVTTQPISETVAAGNAASFTATASGNPAPTVQWEVSTNGGSSWAPISGATAITYTFTSLTSQTGDQFEAVFTNSAGAATTNAATLTVTNASAPQITTQPANQIVEIGATATFSAAASGSPVPTVQWQVSTNGGSSWGNVAGATSTTYSFATTPAELGYSYRAVFTNIAASATTSAATLTPASGNWSGYVAQGTFTAVNGSWTVPAVTCSGRSSTYSAHWIGIDGYTSDSVEQDGTEADCSRGAARYDAWYEMYGDDSLDNGNEVELSPSIYPVDPGDAMSASVSVDVTVNGDVWTLAISDATAGWSYSTPVTWNGAAQSSAEWIGERPEICSNTCALASLADFGSLSFSSASATGNGTTGSISAFADGPLDMVGNSNDLLATPGPLDPAGDAFTDIWNASS